MAYVQYGYELGKPDSVIDELLKRKSDSQVGTGVVPSPSPAVKQGTSSSSNNNTGESKTSLSTFISNYEKLPVYLQSCLVYSSFVSSRYPVEKGNLARLLSAEGLVRDNPEDIMEDVAANAVKELIDLGMLQESGDMVEVPDSYRELSVLKLEKQDFVSKTPINSSFRVYIKDDGRDLHPDFKGILIRSLFLITADSWHSSYFPTRGLSLGYMKAICGLRFLLVMDLYGKIERLPDQVGDLIHLRYLGLASSHLDELPRTLGNLQRLRTLDIRMCGNLSKLPIEVLQIQRLRHLLMSKSVNNGEIRVPKGLTAMVNLRTLTGVYGGDGIARELSALIQLRELGVKRVSDDHASELFEAIMKMENLISLSLEAEETYFEDTSLTLFPELEEFCPPPLLQEFYLHGGLVEIPKWLASMESLTDLRLSFTYLSENPTPILQSLPKLKHLTLWQAYKATHIGKEFCEAGGFPVLETLTIASRFLVGWTEIVNEAFPRLKFLSFRNCLRLILIPEGLQNISTLEELSLIPMHQDLLQRLKGEENYKIKHIPKFRFLLPFN